MKNAIVLLASIALATNAGAQTRFNSQPGKSSVKLQGSSTFHDWEMEGRVIGGYFELGSGVAIDAAKGAITGLKGEVLPATVRANISLTTIHSKAEHLPEVMDNLMLGYMNATNYPTIRYISSSLTVTNSGPGKPFECSATGDLSIAGVTNKMTFPVTLAMPDPTHLEAAGTVHFKMTDFKVSPPAPHPLGLPTMKCGDDITIIFDWVLQKR
ncbi:MAG TPA: YceI family protein [Verrucomicrobiae bacterium]|jgi:polyisoprenoid-binding protein YceI|nr:YceI family protein [Verrucomicrobiae bacterium]